jgi:hypothetical protein
MSDILLTETSTLSDAIGRGLICGLAGTLGITLANNFERSLTHRPHNNTPAFAVEKMLDIIPKKSEDEHRLSLIAHWGYGISWGLFRSALDEAGVEGWTATAVHYTAVFGVALFALPAMNIYPPVKKWPRRRIITDAIEHAIYSAVAGMTYQALKNADEEQCDQPNESE